MLAENTEMQAQFEQAMADRNHEVACFCLRSMIVQAAGDYRVGMAGQVSVCGPLRARRKGVHSPPWFDTKIPYERSESIYDTASRESRCLFMGLSDLVSLYMLVNFCGSSTRFRFGGQSMHMHKNRGMFF